MVSPVEVFKPALDHNPTVTPTWAMMKDHSTICFGEFANKRAVNAGITNNAPISNEPTARKANTVNNASNNIKIRRCHLALTPSLTAISGSMAI